MVPKQICRLLPALVAGAAVVMLSFERSSEGKIRIAMPAVPAAAAGPGGRAAADKNKAGLHIPQGRQVSFTYTLNDGGGYRWDIQYYGTIGQGTNYAYSGGLYCQINGSNIHSSGRGWINQAGDEVEIGPYSRSNLRIYRRIKVYKDRGLARWLDIFENPTGAPITVGVNIYSNTNWQVGNRIFSSGKGSFTEEDTAFVTRTQGGNAPAVFHYVCGKKSKLRPTIDIRSNQIYVRWNLTIPAGKSIVLCYFESQNNSITDLTKLMGSFKPDKVMKDLPASVRKLIVNIPARRGIGGVELERIESADTVFNKNGDPVYGTITDKTFGVETLFGKMDVPADQVIGMASAGGEDERLRIALTGGQVIAGRLADDDKIHLELPSGGALNVPFADVQQWSYRISKQRPEEAEFAGPLMILRTGDRIGFQPGSVALKLRTRHGMIDLDAKDLLHVTLDNAGNAVHRVTFLNGSRLGGFLQPEQIPLTLKLGPKLTISRNLVARMQFALEEKSDATLDSVSLSNGDELLGRIATDKFTLRTDYGEVTFRPENIRAMAFSPTHLGRAALRLWDGSILRGQCTRDTLKFQVSPGPLVDIYVGQLAEVRRSQALPPKDIRDKLQRLVGQLGAESYKDRQAATEQLMKMGKGIVPLLRKYVGTSDPEVRQRIEDVIEKLGGNPSAPAPAPGPAMKGVFLNLNQRAARAGPMLMLGC